jgi:hypothetical protein
MTLSGDTVPRVNAVLTAGAGTLSFWKRILRSESSTFRVKPLRREPRLPSVRFQTTIDSMGCEARRSTSHHGSRVPSRECVWPPSPKVPLVLPSMPRPASPPCAVFFCDALPCRATLTPPENTSTSASVSVRCRPGSSMRTYRPAGPMLPLRGPSSSLGSPDSSADTFG